jgi:hypothetical protein
MPAPVFASSYFFLPLLPFRCERSLPATDLTPLGTFGLFRSLPALDASFLLNRVNRLADLGHPSQETDHQVAE